MPNTKFEMWQVEKNIGFEANVFMAMEIYTRKSGQKADLVQINPEDLNEQKIDCVGFELQAVKTVLKGTILVGRKTDGEN